MAQGIISGGKLSRHWDALRKSQPVAGVGLLTTGGPRGQFWHRRMFRVGMPVPDGELTEEQLDGYEEVNTFRDTLGNGRKSSGSPTPLAQMRPKMWTGGKAMVLTKSTRKALMEAAERSEVRCVDGARATGGPMGAVITRRDGFAGAGAAFGRRSALAPQGSRVDGAKALRTARAIPVGGGSGTTRRVRSGGTEIGQAQPSILPLIRVAIVNDDGASLGVGAFLQAGGSVPLFEAEGSVRAIPWWTTPAGDQGLAWRRIYPANGRGSVRHANIEVWLRHERTGFPDETQRAVLTARFLSGVSRFDPDTWPELLPISCTGDADHFERWTVISVGWF